MNCLTLGELGWLDKEPEACRYLVSGEAKYAYYFPRKSVRGASTDRWDLVELCVAVAGGGVSTLEKARALEIGPVLLVSKYQLDELHDEIREILDQPFASLDLLSNLNVVSLYGLHFALLDEFGRESELFIELLALIGRIRPVLVALDYLGSQACSKRHATQFLAALEKMASLGPAIVIKTKQNLDGLRMEGRKNED